MSDNKMKVIYLRAMLINFIQLEARIGLSFPFLKEITAMCTEMEFRENPTTEEFMMKLRFFLYLK